MEAMDLNVINPDFWKNKRVLVTGHTGFKGSWLLLWLLEMGANVYGIGLEPDSTIGFEESLFAALDLSFRLGDSHFICDVRNTEELSAVVHECKPDVVFHLAAQPLVSQSYDEPLYTWETNVLGTLNLLEALKKYQHPCSVVLISTDKVYENREWEWGYREEDRLGGADPYSASKAAMELLVSSWRSSFCGSNPHQSPYLSIATARAGNVIGGGDWSNNRIVPDTMRALVSLEYVQLRNPLSSRPWQHVLEPLAGYLLLAQQLSVAPDLHARAYNFGPDAASNRIVSELVEQLISEWPSSIGCRDISNFGTPHEAGLLNLVSDRARCCLGWKPRWDFMQTCRITTTWYYRVYEGESPLVCCLDDLNAYINS